MMTGSRRWIGAGSVTGLAMLALAVWASGCGDGGVEPQPPDPPRPTSVTVTPATAALSALGATVRLSAQVRDQNGQVMMGASVAWSSGSASVATVDASGLVTAAANGAATVTATAGTASGTAAVTVAQSVSAVVVTPADDTVLVADTVRFAAGAFDANGHAVAGAEFSWASSDTLVAVVDGAGLVTAASGGAATITATAGDVSGTALVTVIQSVVSVDVSPAADTIAPGDTLRLVAEAFDENGHRVQGAAFVWSSSDVTVVRVDASGLVTGVGDLFAGVGVGRAMVTASAGEASAASKITVEHPDHAALVAFYHATGGPNWTNNENWLTDALLHRWYGVGMDHNTGRVTRISLTRNNLTGPIPSELGNLSKLRALNLWENHLTGPIPPELGNLGNLEVLQLSYNQLRSVIPADLANLGSLEVLSLSSNQLTGTIPAWLGNLSNLRELALWDNLISGPIPPELSRLDSLSILTLTENDLTGPLPAELAKLQNLTAFTIDQNNLSGPVPDAFLELEGLEHLWFEANAGLCARGTSDFNSWLNSIEDVRGPYCNESDMKVLERLYETSGGLNWTNSRGWLQTPVLDEWHGVTADALGRVVTLDLTRNGLTGGLRADLGSLAEMTALRLGANSLSGRLPLSLTLLALVELRYADTGLCAPADAAFRTWLNGIESLDGTGAECGSLSDREILEILYEATHGASWTNSDNWLTDAPLYDWYGVDATSSDHVINIRLPANGLSGTLPLELGNLADLSILRLSANDLSGAIPPTLGNPSLDWLLFDGNDLSGAIPPTLGRSINLTRLNLSRNAFTGSLPPEFGSLAALEELRVGGNAGLSGVLPASLTTLRRLQTFVATGTGLCAPAESGFLSWLRDIPTRRVRLCSQPDGAATYLTQTVQSRESPVPLVASEEALLRVFVTAPSATSARLPPVRATFYLDGTEALVTNIASGASPIPADVDESDLSKSLNALVPADIVQPGLEMVIEIDPHGTLDPGLGVSKRIPATGRQAVEVRAMPLFDLTLVPFLWSENPDSTVINAVERAARDPDVDELLGYIRKLMPVGELAVTAHAPVLTDTNNGRELLSATRAIRAMEGGGGHYMGTMSRDHNGSGWNRVPWRQVDGVDAPSRRHRDVPRWY